LRPAVPFAEDDRAVTDPEPSVRSASIEPPPPSHAPRPASIPPPPRVEAPTLYARVLPEVVAGLISSTLILSFGISLAALIFAGDLARHLPAGIGVLLASTAVIAALVALFSSYRPVIAAPQENTSVILAIVAATIGRRLPAGEGTLATLIAAIGLTSAATGVLFFVLGSFRLGKIVRFIPYPVVGGFLAGTGWLLVQGSLGVMSDLPVGLADVPRLLAPGVLMKWVPGIAYGLVLTAVLRRYKHYLVLPGLLLGGIAAFYAIVVAAGPGVSGAMAGGFLLGPFPGGGLWPPITPAALGHVEWSLLRESAGTMLACTVLAAISVLLNATGLELATEQDLDLDRELRFTGVANVVVGLAGGVPGYLSLSESTLNYKVGARSRAPGLIAAALSVATLVAGTGALAYFPKPILGGLLFFLGVSFLIETVYDAFFRLPRLEYGLVILILVVVVMVGFLEGVGAGIVVASVLFAVNYARIDVVKHAISGAGLRSKAGRTPGAEAYLQQTGGHIHVMALQGYIFFGTAYQLLLRVKDRLLSSQPLPVYFLVLDFRHVDGLDSSAVVTFARMRKLAEAQGAVLVFTELPPSVKRQLERGGCLPPGEPRPGERRTSRAFSDLDHGLEWCEGELLLGGGKINLEDTLTQELETVVSHRALVHRLLGYLERFEVPAGHVIYRKGEESKDLYLIDKGELEAWLDLEDGRTLRLRTMGAGSVVGESGLYLDARRSASVRATRPSRLYRLSIPALDRMTREAPELAAAFHRFVARLLADRMVNTTSAAQMLFY
jgi:SulP family sulfate permease